MHNYYFLCAKEYREMSIAQAPKGTKMAYELYPELAQLAELPFDFSLIKMSDSTNGFIESEDLAGLKNVWMDYQWSHPIYPLMSEKLKSVVCAHLSGNEGIRWMSAKVTATDETRNYYIPVFQSVLDVLDMQKQKFIPGTKVLNPPWFFSYEKVKNMAIFHVPDKPALSLITTNLYISERLKKTIQKEKLLGITFEKTVID